MKCKKNILSAEAPEIVKAVAALTELDHRYSPGDKVSPPMLP
jgi:hypothetical protein